jgi:hypothetical protein
VHRPTKEALPKGHRRATWLGAVFLVFAIVLAAWSVWLGFVLPRRTAALHWDLAWSGFDIGLAVALGLTAGALFRRSPWLLTAAGASAALLVCDAWFDVVTSRPSGRGLAILEAVLVELPLAAFCLWIAVRTERAIESAADLRAFGRRLRRLAPDDAGDPPDTPR